MRLRLVLILMAFAWNCFADDNDNSSVSATNEPLFFRVSIVAEYPLNLPPQQRVYVNFGANKFTMVVPKHYRVQTEPEQRRVTFINLDDYSQLAFRIAGPAANFTVDSYRTLLFSRYPGAKITEEFSFNTDGQSGTAFDMEWRPSGGDLKSLRMGFAPSAAGSLEFGLISTPDTFSSAKSAFNQLLLTLRSSDKNGHLDIAQPSDKL